MKWEYLRPVSSCSIAGSKDMMSVCSAGEWPKKGNNGRQDKELQGDLEPELPHHGQRLHLQHRPAYK